MYMVSSKEEKRWAQDFNFPSSLCVSGQRPMLRRVSACFIYLFFSNTPFVERLIKNDPDHISIYPALFKYIDQLCKVIYDMKDTWRAHTSS